MTDNTPVDTMICDSEPNEAMDFDSSVVAMPLLDVHTACVDELPRIEVLHADCMGAYARCQALYFAYVFMAMVNCATLFPCFYYMMASERKTWRVPGRNGRIPAI